VPGEETQKEEKTEIEPYIAAGGWKFPSPAS
jgi:hypothetical protein